MSAIDVHQHVWTDPLVEALSERDELPFVRVEHDLTVLYAAGERPYVLDTSAGSPEPRTRLLDRDGIARALVCISSPLGIEALPREQAAALIDAYHAGALALGDRFGVWGAIPLERPQAADVDRVLELGCVGVSLPAGAIASLEGLAGLQGVLERLAEHGAPLFVHPGPGRTPVMAPPPATLGDPLWWPALTVYVAQMQAAWLAFATAGRQAHPELRVVFAMFAGLAPLHAERLQRPRGPAGGARRPQHLLRVLLLRPRPVGSARITGRRLAAAVRIRPPDGPSRVRARRGAAVVAGGREHPPGARRAAPGRPARGGPASGDTRSSSRPSDSRAEGWCRRHDRRR